MELTNEDITFVSSSKGASGTNVPKTKGKSGTLNLKNLKLLTNIILKVNIQNQDKTKNVLLLK